MDLFDSFVRLTWDPDGDALVLVDYETPMWEPVEIDGGRVVQAVELLRAVGVRHFARGQESHRLRFVLCRVEDDMEDALAARMNSMCSLPTGTADVLLSLGDGRNWRLHSCAVRGWGGGQEEVLTREMVEIVCGRITPDEGTYAPGQTWGEIALEWGRLG